MTRDELLTWAVAQSWTQNYLHFSKKSEKEARQTLSDWLEVISAFIPGPEEDVYDRMVHAGDQSYALFKTLDEEGLNNALLHDFYNGDMKLVYSFRGVCDEVSLIQDSIIDEIRAKGYKDILDFGGGNGRFIITAAKALPNVNFTYTDLNKLGVKFVNFAKDKFNLKNVRTLYEVKNDLLVLDKLYDCIVSIDVLEHFLDPEKIINQLSSHIKATGSLIALINCHAGADHPTSTAQKYGGEAREDVLFNLCSLKLEKNLGRKVKVWKK